MSLLPDQQKIYEHNEGDLIVSASAGSGKTFIMIERLIRLLSEVHEDKNGNKVKTKISEILALTFTEAAASEMKIKLKSKLEEKFAETGDSTILEAIADLSIADVGTIHGFCAKTIRRFFSEVDVSAGFSVVDDEKKAQFINLAMEKTFSDFYSFKNSNDENQRKLHESFILTNARYGKDLKEIIVSVYSYLTSKISFDDEIKKSLETVSEENVKAELALLWEKLSLEIKECYDEEKLLEKTLDGLGLTEKTTEKYKTAIAVTEKMLKAKDIYEYVSIPNININKQVGNLKPEKKIPFCDFVDTVTKIKEKHNKYSKFIKPTEKENDEYFLKVKKQLSDFISVLCRFKDNYEKLKKDENVLDFNDLEKYMLIILNNPEVRKQIRERYKFIVIDEYQDVNDVQSAILEKINNDNTFMVGDLKQSIYGFRGSNPEQFYNKQIELEKKGGAQGLNYNFRSAKKVVDAVNEIFEYCMTVSSFGLDYKLSKLNYKGKYEGTPDKPADGRAFFHYISGKSEEGDSDDTTDTLLDGQNKHDENIIDPCGDEVKDDLPRVYDIIEDSKTATEKDVSETGKRVAEIIFDELGKEYYDAFAEVSDNAKKFKKVSYKDITVLVRSNGKATQLAKDLIRYNIPVISKVETEINDYKEVAVLINTLKLITCFENPIPLATVMKSPIGGFTELDLYVLANAYKDYAKREKKDKKTYENLFLSSVKYALINTEHELHDRVKKFKEYIDELRDFADFNSAKVVLKKIIRESDYSAHVISKRNGEEKIKRVNRLVSASGENGEKTVAEFINDIEINPVTISPRTVKDAVQITTMHSSKGLQYPVCIVPFLESPFNKADDSETVMTDGDLGLVTLYFDDEKKFKYDTLFREKIKEKNKIKRAREEMRLFYVALTRAEYSLHLIYCDKNDKRKDNYETANCFCDFIPEKLEKFESFSEENLAKLSSSNREKDKLEIRFANIDSDEVKKLKEKLNFKYENIADTTLPIKSSVTSALKSDSEDAKNSEGEVFELYDEKEEGQNPLFGTTAHKILELYDFNGSESFDEQVKKMVNDKAIDYEIAKSIISPIKKLVTGKFGEMIKNKKIYREKSFIVSLSAKEVLDVDTKSDVLVQGIIDLLMIDGDRAVIVDYKYSSKKKEKLIESYRKQLKLYQSAVQKILKIEKVETYIVSIISGEWYKV